ncbi:MAG: preprotein translocase subunit YajC [Anaerolineae bacterium]|nr:preprotein translocase subunit YajC [Anaerolineae bacterium]MDW8173261.1 preprotein translocase subunit YajC [Anaerolineae bacterium]
MNEIILLAVVMALGLSAYWAMVLFPRQRDFTKRQQMARELAKGDEVITYGGLIGKVVKIDSERGIALIEISEGVQVRMVIASLMQRYDPDEIAKNARMGQPAAEQQQDVTL